MSALSTGLSRYTFISIAGFSSVPRVENHSPLSIWQALAAGRPIVATAVGGNPEVVHEGENGFLVPPDDPAGLATRMLTLLKDSALRVTMGLVSLALARGYDWQVIIPAYRAVFDETLTRHQGQR